MLLCIWFLWDMACLTLKIVQTNRGIDSQVRGFRAPCNAGRQGGILRGHGATAAVAALPGRRVEQFWVEIQQT